MLCVFVKVLNKVGVDYVVFGLIEIDMGDVVCWFGDEVMF